MSDPDELVASLLRLAIPDATVETEMSPNMQASRKYVFVHSAFGASSARPNQTDTPAVEVVSFAKGGRAAGWALAKQIQLALYAAWFYQTGTEDGWISRFATTTRPTLMNVPGQPNGFSRFYAVYDLVTRMPVDERVI